MNADVLFIPELVRSAPLGISPLAKVGLDAELRCFIGRKRSKLDSKVSTRTPDRDLVTLDVPSRSYRPHPDWQEETQHQAPSEPGTSLHIR